MLDRFLSGWSSTPLGGDRRSTFGARWARRADVRSLRVRSAERGRLILGRGPGGLLATESRHSVLVFGPTQSGKTTGLAIPAILEWEGPVVATSVKGDLVASTHARRSQLGPCHVFDPTYSVGSGHSVGWSPLQGSMTWREAQRMAAWLIQATPARGSMTDGTFWYSAAAKLLAPLLLAAALAGLSPAEIVSWNDSEDFERAGLILASAGEEAALRALSACSSRDDRLRSSVSATLDTVLEPWHDPIVASCQNSLDIETLLRDNGTLHVCGPVHEQSRLQGLFSALISSVLNAAIERACMLGGPLDPPLLVVLDEVANIAPLPDLDSLASTAAALGVQLVTICQDLAQLSARYGEIKARTIVNNHRAKLVLSGLSDVGTLEMVSTLAGETLVYEHTTTADYRSHGGRSRSTSRVPRRLLPTHMIRVLPPGQAALIYGHLPPARMKLRPWYEDRHLRSLASVG